MGEDTRDVKRIDACDGMTAEVPDLISIYGKTVCHGV